MTESKYKKVPILENEQGDQSGVLENEEGCTDLKEPLKYGYGKRHIQVFLYFLCISMGYASRAHLAVTIVGMTTLDFPKESTKANIIDRNTKIFMDDNNTNLNNSNYSDILIHSQDNFWNIYRKYSWSKSKQEMVHGSFFLGYTIMMFPIGMVCHRWGGKMPLQIAMIVNAFVSFFTPWLIAWGSWEVLCVCRLLQGLSQAGLFPGIQTLLANWASISERSSLSSYVYTGIGFGTVLGFQLAGILTSSKFGWPSTFWAIGIICLIVFILITFLGAITPNEHKSISEAEKLFIIGKVTCVEHSVNIPWKSILTSLPVWSTFVAHIGSAVCFVFFFIQMPTYMHTILKLDIRSNGILSSLPYVAMVFFCMAYGLLSDFFINKNKITTRNARRLSNSVGSFIPALCCALVSYTTNISLAVFCFITSFAAHAAIHSSWMVNYMDLSPNFAGTLMATGNTITNILVLLVPVMVTNVVTDTTNQYQWRIMMLLMAGIATTSNIIFITFMSADIQPWNEFKFDDANENENIQMEMKKEIETLAS